MIRVAIDARLVETKSTGDTSYWRGLIAALEAIAPADVNIVLYGMGEQPDGFAAGLEWRTVTSKSSRVWSLVDFPRTALTEGADVLHTQYNLSPLVADRGVTTIHDISFFINPSWYSLKDRILLLTQIPRTVKRAAAILTVSETSRKEIESRLPAARDKTFVTPNALDSGFRPPERGAAQKTVRAQFGLSQPYLFAINSRWKRKNIPMLYQAWSKLNPATAPALVTCGPGESYGPGHYHLGYVEDEYVPALYAAAECFLLPSFHEGFGIPLLEAFAARCPVIASTGGAIPEVAGGAARLVESFRPEDWAEAIRELLAGSGTVQERVQMGLERVKAYSWHETALRTLNVYREVASRGR